MTESTKPSYQALELRCERLRRVVEAKMNEELHLHEVRQRKDLSDQGLATALVTGFMLYEKYRNAAMALQEGDLDPIELPGEVG